MHLNPLVHSQLAEFSQQIQFLPNHSVVNQLLLTGNCQKPPAIPKRGFVSLGVVFNHFLANP